MVRRYDEPIDVRATATPEAFLWRGRVFVVREVLDRWQERRAWWRAGPRSGSDGGSGGGGDGAGPHLDGDGIGVGEIGVGEWLPSRERQVWRVEASAGRLARVGVFDLGFDGADDWLLLRTHD